MYFWLFKIVIITFSYFIHLESQEIATEKEKLIFNPATGKLEIDNFCPNRDNIIVPLSISCTINSEEFLKSG